MTRPKNTICLWFDGTANEAAHFEDERRGFVIVHHDEGVGGGAVVLVTQPAAEAEDFWGEFIHAEHPR